MTGRPRGSSRGEIYHGNVPTQALCLLAPVASLLRARASQQPPHRRHLAARRRLEHLPAHRRRLPRRPRHPGRDRRRRLHDRAMPPLPRSRAAPSPRRTSSDSPLGPSHRAMLSSIDIGERSLPAYPGVALDLLCPETCVQQPPTEASASLRRLETLAGRRGCRGKPPASVSGGERVDFGEGAGLAAPIHAVAAARVWLWSLVRLWVAVIRRHSVRAADLPRR